LLPILQSNWKQNVIFFIYLNDAAYQNQLKVVFAAKGHLIFLCTVQDNRDFAYFQKLDFSKMAPILQTIENFFAI